MTAFLEGRMNLSERDFQSSSGNNNLVGISSDNNFPIRSCCVDSGGRDNMRNRNKNQTKPNVICSEHVDGVMSLGKTSLFVFSDNKFC